MLATFQRLATFHQLFSWNTGIGSQGYLSVCANPLLPGIFSKGLFQGLFEGNLFPNEKVSKERTYKFLFFLW